jgi:hypothetical protein
VKVLKTDESAIEEGDSYDSKKTPPIKFEDALKIPTTITCHQTLKMVLRSGTQKGASVKWYTHL